MSTKDLNPSNVAQLVAKWNENANKKELFFKKSSTHLTTLTLFLVLCFLPAFPLAVAGVSVVPIYIIFSLLGCTALCAPLYLLYLYTKTRTACDIRNFTRDLQLVMDPPSENQS